MTIKLISDTAYCTPQNSVKITLKFFFSSLPFYPITLFTKHISLSPLTLKLMVNTYLNRELLHPRAVLLIRSITVFSLKEVQFIPQINFPQSQETTALPYGKQHGKRPKEVNLSEQHLGQLIILPALGNPYGRRKVRKQSKIYEENSDHPTQSTIES